MQEHLEPIRLISKFWEVDLDISKKNIMIYKYSAYFLGSFIQELIEYLNKNDLAFIIDDDDCGTYIMIFKP